MEERKVIDITGIELTPGNSNECLGNGKHTDEHGKAIACCCDECGYYIKCFPDWE